MGGTAAGNVITWTGLDVPVGTTIDLTFDVTVEAPGDGVDFDNIAEVIATDQFDEDSTPGNGPDPDGDGLIGPEDTNPNDGSVDPDPAAPESDEDDDADNEPVEPQVADISLIKTVSDAEPNVGDVVTFTIEVSNAGPNDATGVSVEDAVPNGFSGISNISNGGSDAAGLITWVGLNIDAGSSVSLTFDVTVEAPLPGVEFSNIANVTEADQFDPDSEPGNDPDTDGDGMVGSEDDNPNDSGADPDDEDDADDEPVEPQVVDISLIKIVDNPEPNVGDVITFTITVSNDGPNDATGVSVEDNVPNGFSGIATVSYTHLMLPTILLV